MLNRSLSLSAYATPGVVLALLTLPCVWNAAWAQQPQQAGRVVFATGNPVAVAVTGAERNLRRGDDVFSGDTLITRPNGRLQVSFVDGAYISVQPDSQYRIEEYRYSGRPDGTESAIYQLIKGGVRALTGLIGRENRDAYEVRTAVATIGIRGTGHNTRFCQGDCPGEADGLYHHTWEGITYVFNNAGNVDVPTGQGVYVPDLNAPIRFLTQPPGITALQQADEREREQRREEVENRVIAAGDQRNDRGRRVAVAVDDMTPTASTVLLNQTFVGVLPAISGMASEAIAGTDASIFSNDAGIVGILSDEQADDGGALRSVGTVDPPALLGGDDPASVAQVRELLALANPGQLVRFQADPAAAVESVSHASGLGWGRWAGSRVLVVDETGETTVRELRNEQSVHFIFGPEPGTLPATGQAFYAFTGGTDSTSLSGMTTGQGATGGRVSVDFAASSAFLNMDVGHDDIDYAVGGRLEINAGDNVLFSLPDAVSAFTTARGSACNPSCPTAIEGAFTGPATDSDVPANIGLYYDIGETDAITGVAGFTRTPEQLPPLTEPGF